MSLRTANILRALLAVAAFALAGCEGTITFDFGSGAPADPDIERIEVTLLGLEFETASGSRTLEWRDAETFDLMDFVSGEPLRVFTDEELPDGTYTGVRLLFADDPALTVTDSDGTESTGEVVQGEFADLNFTIEEDERSSAEYVLVLDLRRSLVRDESSGEYTLTPVLRAVKSEQVAAVDGVVTGECPSGSVAAEDGAVYAFAGEDVVPDDLDGSGVEPYASARIRSTVGGTGLAYELDYLAPGPYTLAVTCRGPSDAPGTDDDLQFATARSLSLAAGDDKTLTLEAP